MSEITMTDHDQALKLRDRIDQLMDERHFPAHLYDTCEELKEIAAELSDLRAARDEAPAEERSAESLADELEDMADCMAKDDGAIPCLRASAKRLRAQPQSLTATQLADAIDRFWNAALGAAREHQTGTSAEVASVMVHGMAAIAQGLRESSNG